MRFPSDHVFADLCVSVTLSDNLNVLPDGDTFVTSIPPNPTTSLNTAWTAVSKLCAARSKS